MNERWNNLHRSFFIFSYIHPNVTITNGLVDRKLKIEQKLPVGFVFGLRKNFIVDVQRYNISNQSELLEHAENIKQIILNANK